MKGLRHNHSILNKLLAPSPCFLHLVIGEFLAAATLKGRNPLFQFFSTVTMILKGHCMKSIFKNLLQWQKIPP